MSRVFFHGQKPLFIISTTYVASLLTRGPLLIGRRGCRVGISLCISDGPPAAASIRLKGSMRELFRGILSPPRDEGTGATLISSGMRNCMNKMRQKTVSVTLFRPREERGRTGWRVWAGRAGAGATGSPTASRGYSIVRRSRALPVAGQCNPCNGGGWRWCLWRDIRIFGRKPGTCGGVNWFFPWEIQRWRFSRSRTALVTPPSISNRRSGERVSPTAVTRMAASSVTGHSCSQMPQPMHSAGST